MKIVAVDLGTRCGYAVLNGSAPVVVGVMDFSTRKHEGGGFRYLRFAAAIRELLSPKPQLVAYEEVRRHLGTDAAHVYGGLLAHLQAICEELKVPYVGIPVAAVKRAATGKGNADKAAVLEAARERWPKLEIVDDNAADALFVLECARHELGVRS